jgi:hypothetical protein
MGNKLLFKIFLIIIEWILIYNDKPTKTSFNNLRRLDTSNKNYNSNSSSEEYEDLHHNNLSNETDSNVYEDEDLNTHPKIIENNRNSKSPPSIINMVVPIYYNNNGMVKIRKLDDKNHSQDTDIEISMLTTNYDHVSDFKFNSKGLVCYVETYKDIVEKCALMSLSLQAVKRKKRVYSLFNERNTTEIEKDLLENNKLKKLTDIVSIIKSLIINLICI